MLLLLPMAPRPTLSPLQPPLPSPIAPALSLCQCILPPQWLALPGTSSSFFQISQCTVLQVEGLKANMFFLYSSSSTWGVWSSSSSASSSSSTPVYPVSASTSSAWVGWTSSSTVATSSTPVAAVSYSTSWASTTPYAPASYTTPAVATFTGAANQVVAQAGAGLAAIAGVAAYLL